MDASQSTLPDPAEKPRAVRLGLWLVVGLLCVGATYLYAVRGTAILLDLSSGIAGLLCM